MRYKLDNYPLSYLILVLYLVLVLYLDLVLYLVLDLKHIW